MATRPLLAQLTEQYGRAAGQAIAFEAVGGVNAEKRILGGEPFDLIMLAADAMDRLAAAGKIDRDSLVGVVNSSIAVAVKTGSPGFDAGDVQAVRDAVRRARAVGYSTGPSGRYILQLLGTWGIPGDGGDSSAGPHLMQARPGVPVGSLVASGEVDIGFQQVSELMHVDGIRVLGLLPEPIQKTTTFSAAMGSSVRNRAAARAFLDFLISPEAEPAKVANGMTAA